MSSNEKVIVIAFLQNQIDKKQKEAQNARSPRTHNTKIAEAGMLTRTLNIIKEI